MKIKIGDLVTYRLKYIPDSKASIGIVFNFEKVDLKEEISLHLNEDEMSELLQCLSINCLEEINMLSGVKVLWSDGDVTTSYIDELDIVSK
jgi:hypothetical protein